MSIGFGIAVSAAAFTSGYCEVHDKSHAALLWFLFAVAITAWNRE